MRKKGNIKQKIKKKLSLREKLGYGAGDFANSLTYDCGQMNLLKFYTDVLRIPGAIGGSIFLLVKIFDAFSDVTVGNFVDTRRNIGKRGKFRPFILFGCVPLAIINIVAFTAPNLSLNGKIAYACVTYMAFGLAYSIVNIPYGSLQSSMTQDVQERTQLASFRQFGASLALLLTGVAVMPLVLKSTDVKVGYMMATGTMSVIAVIAHIFCYKSVKENVVVEQKAKQKQQLSRILKVVVTNKPLLILDVLTLLTISSYGLKMAMMVYYCQYVLNNVSLIAMLTFVSVGFSLIGVAVVPFVVKHVGKKNTFIIGCSIWAIGDMMNFILPTNYYTFLIFASVAWFGTAFINTLNWAFVSDAVEYGEWRTGERTEGIIYSSYAFFRKFAQALAGFIPGVVLSLIGYVPNVKQSLETLTGIKGLMFLCPVAAMILSIIVMKLFYKLSDKRYLEILTELKARKELV